MAMTSSSMYNNIGIIGAGSFGTVIANIAAEHADCVYVYARSSDRLTNFNIKKENDGYTVHDKVVATNSIEQITKHCTIIYCMVPSKYFRSMIREFSPFLYPHHILIHGTKGVDISLPEGKTLDNLEGITRKDIHTMSEVILQETSVRRVGCLSGPNLSGEIAAGFPAGAIVASKYNEVFQAGKKSLSSSRFKLFNSTDITGAEFAGILKNIFAIAAGVLDGLGYGNNARALLITKGLHEMLFLGNKLGGETNAFLGIAGIGDLVATCSSPLSRNYTVGKFLAEGKTLDQISQQMNQVAEGVRSVQIFYAFAKHHRISLPFTETLYQVFFNNKSCADAVQSLMNYKYSTDVTFL